MPSMTFADLQPKEFKVVLIEPPVTEVESSTGWSMSYHTARRPQELFYVEQGFAGLGDDELHELERLPRSMVAAFSEQANDPEVVEYLRGALHTGNPYETIVRDLTNVLYEDAVGLGDYDEDGLGSLRKKLKKVVKKVKTVHKKVLTTVKKVHAKITPKPLLKIQKKVHAVAKKSWKKYGNIVIGVAGAVLAPFTGGASLAAASVIVAGKQMYDAKKMADAAKKAAKADANLIAAEAAKQEAQVLAQVEAFYRENQAWFLQYDMTPDKWAKLTLDQKIEFINAGVAGTLPAGAVDTNVPPAQATAQTQQTVAAAASAGIPTNAVIPPPPPGSPPPYYTGGGPSVGYDTSGGGAPPPEAPAAQSVFEGIIEGKSIGTFPSVDDAYNAILSFTKPGDRFEIITGGKSLGLAVRTGEGAVDVPPEAEAQMRAMSREQAHQIVEKADEEVAAKKGGFPWWVLIVGGVAVAAATSSS